MNMAATIEYSVLDSIIKQAIALPESLRLILADQAADSPVKKVSLLLSSHLREVRTIHQNSENLKIRTEKLSIKTTLSTKQEVETDIACDDCILITRKLKKSFEALSQVNHFWIARKIRKVINLLDSSLTNIDAIHTNLRRFYSSTQWQRDTYLASKDKSLGKWLSSNTISVSANDWDVFETELDREALLTPIQLKAQQRYLSKQHNA